VGGGKIRCRPFHMDLLCMSIHAASPVWVCGGWPEDPVSPFSYGFPKYFYTFCLSSVGLRWVAGRSGVAYFLWISNAFTYILPLQCGSVVTGRKIRCRLFPIDFSLYFHTFCLSSVGLL
jgi:hypothetical protein